MENIKEKGWKKCTFQSNNLSLQKRVPNCSFDQHLYNYAQLEQPLSDKTHHRFYKYR